MLGNYNKVFEGIRVDGKQKGKLINYIVKGAGKQSNSQTVKHNKECEECHVKGCNATNLTEFWFKAFNK